MKGLILKDFLNLKKNFRIFAVLALIYGVMSFSSGDPSFFSTIFTMLFAILTLSTYSYDELAKWDGYALTMPVSKDNIVQEKYIMMLLLTMIGFTLSLVFSLVLNYIKGYDHYLQGLINCAVAAAIVILFYSITLPFITKLGVEKARLIFFAVYIIPFMLIMLLKKLSKNDIHEIPKELIDLFYFIQDNIAIILPIVVIVSLGISYLVSHRIYSKKEF